MGPEAVNVDGARSDNNDDLLCWTDRCKWPGGRFSSSRTLLGGDVGEGDGDDIAADYSWYDRGLSRNIFDDGDSLLWNEGSGDTWKHKAGSETWGTQVQVGCCCLRGQCDGSSQTHDTGSVFITSLQYLCTTV